jgi:formylglycine-generating enzyme required for sulfatase activity
VNNSFSHYGTDIDSLPLSFQGNQTLLFSFGLELVLLRALKNTVFLAEDKQLQLQRELDEAAAAQQSIALSGVPDSGLRIVKLAHASEESSQQHVDNFLCETKLLKHLYQAGVPVPRLITSVAANSLLNKDSGLRVPHPALMVQDFVDGVSLRDAIAADSLLERAEKVGILFPKLLNIVAQLQQHQVLHRDLKHDQFLLKANSPVLLDFDKASSHSDSYRYRNTTVSHSPFAAPEVKAGSEHATSDLYSLCAISFWLMTGHDPAPSADVSAADIFQSFLPFWRKGMAAEPAQRFADKDSLQTAFSNALADFKRELTPLDEAKARQQEWLARQQQYEQTLVALNEQQLLQLKSLEPLNDFAAQDYLKFQYALAQLRGNLQSCGQALAALTEQLKQQGAQLHVDLVDETAARTFLALQWLDYSDALANQQQLLNECSSAERMLALASFIPPLDFSAVIAKAADCQQQRQQLEQYLSTCTPDPSQQRLLATLCRSQQNLDRQLSLLQNNASSASHVSSIADVLQQLKQLLQATEILELLVADYAQLSDDFLHHRSEFIALAAPKLVEIRNNSENYVPFIHGWNGEQVKALQQQAANAVGKQVIFQEPLLNGQGLGPKMVVIPAGSFWMGQSDQDDSCRDDEKPGKHKVKHAKHFAVSQYAVTFDDWELCVSQGGCQSNKAPYDSDWGKGQRPVINVSWHDAQEYVAWLSEATGKRYRLLSESEWEYAARAGSTERFAQFGHCIDTQQANYDGNYGVDGCPQSKTGTYLAKTQPVGQYPSNSFGLYDM